MWALASLMVSITKAISRGLFVERITTFTPTTKSIASIVDDRCKVLFLQNKKYTQYVVFTFIM